MGVYIYPALILPALGAPTAPLCPTPKQEPAFGQIDFELGRYGAQGEAKLSRIKAEDKLEIEQLEKVVEAIVNAPEGSVFTGLVSTPKVLFERHPELKAILDSDQELHQKNPCSHHHLFFYFRNPDYWNNAIILLSVLAQKYLEVDDKEGMMKVIRYCHQFKARIERQKLADKKFQPVAYYEAILDLTEAELKAQVKGKKLKAQLLEEMKRKGVDPSTLSKDELNSRLVEAARNYYLEARDQALRAIKALLATKDKFFWPSEPDYFSIPKALVVLGDLNVKLKEVNREEIAHLRRKPADPKVAARIAALEAENVQLVNAAFTLYDLLEKIDENKDVVIKASVDLVGMTINLDFSTQKIKAALKANLDKGYLEDSEMGEALEGIFHYLKAVTMLKKAALLAQILSFDPKDYPPTLPPAFKTQAGRLEYVKAMLLRIGLSATEKDKAKKLPAGVLAALTPPSEEGTVFYELAKGAKKSNDFFFAFGTIVKADLLLAYADLYKFPLDLPSEKAELDEADRYVRYAEVLYKDDDLYKNKKDKKQGGTDHPFRYLYAWSVIKRAEIAVRFAEHLKKQSALISSLTRVQDEFETGEYLREELVHLKAVLFVSRCTARRVKRMVLAGRATRIQLPDDRKIALSLADAASREADFLETPQQVYFKIWARLKRAEARSRLGKWSEAIEMYKDIERDLHQLLAYKERLSWREHSFYAELYFEWAIALLSQSLPGEGKKMLERAYPYCLKSDNRFDYKIRKEWIEKARGQRVVNFEELLGGDISEDLFEIDTRGEEEAFKKLLEGK